MKLRKLRSNESDHAFVGIVTAVLLIGLVVVVLALVNVTYVPQWVKDQEASHMDTVGNQFAQLKYAVSIQSIDNDSTVLSSPVTLARNEIPFFDSTRSSGSLKITSDTCSLFIETNTTENLSIISDSIKGFIPNTYFVQQEYILEGGALILRQDDSNVLLGKPSFQITEYGKNLSITFLKINGVSGKTFVAGQRTYPIYTEVLKNDVQTHILNNVTNVTIETEYAESWYNAINSSLLYSGFNFTMTALSDSVRLDLYDETGDYYNVIIKEVPISCQIAYGIVES